MKTKTLANFAVGLALLISSCSDATTPRPGDVTLTATQVASITAKTQTISAASPELAWLADSIGVILKTGTLAVNVPVTVDGKEQRYYAVSLIRQFIGDSTSWTTEHFIAFDDASNPTDFILVNTYVVVPGKTPIGDFATALGAPAGFAHKVHVSGSTVTDYVGKTGTIDFSVVYGSAACGSSVGVTCTSAFLNSDFSVTQARPDAAPSDVHTFSVTGLTIPGVRLLFN